MGGGDKIKYNFKKIKSNGGEMSNIDVLITVHSEHEGLLSMGNSERARCGMGARA